MIAFASRQIAGRRRRCGLRRGCLHKFFAGRTAHPASSCCRDARMMWRGRAVTGAIPRRSMLSSRINLGGVHETLFAVFRNGGHTICDDGTQDVPRALRHDFYAGILLLPVNQSNAAAFVFGEAAGETFTLMPFACSTAGFYGIARICTIFQGGGWLGAQFPHTKKARTKRTLKNRKKGADGL